MSLLKRLLAYWAPRIELRDDEDFWRDGAGLDPWRVLILGMVLGTILGAVVALMIRTMFGGCP